MKLAFTIAGPPQPKERARKGRGGRFYTPERTRTYESRVGWLAMQARMRRPEAWPLDARYGLTLKIYFPNARRRDVSNCVKSVEDGMISIIYRDDSQIAALAAEACVDRVAPRVEVTVEVLGCVL